VINHTVNSLLFLASKPPAY